MAEKPCGYREIVRPSVLVTLRIMAGKLKIAAGVAATGKVCFDVVWDVVPHLLACPGVCVGEAQQVVGCGDIGASYLRNSRRPNTTKWCERYYRASVTSYPKRGMVARYAEPVNRSEAEGCLN
jgi:hypothetical protein